MAVLMLRFGWQTTYTQMAWFFTKAALLTFGGAYAVLPYVYQGAVTHYAWLTPAQMMDGLALGETTPGPLIMVVAFVGFVGGYAQEVAQQPLIAGAIAACLVTFFTFLPSFIFIFLGAPFIESTQNNVQLSAPLNAITAAVVGVIASLALFFAQHIIFIQQIVWPNGFNSLLHGIDWLVLIAILLAAWLIFKFKINIMYLIIIFGLLGWAHAWL